MSKRIIFFQIFHYNVILTVFNAVFTFYGMKIDQLFNNH